MRHIIIVLFLLPIVAFGQYPINVRNIQTGYQTSGEGLFFRGNGYPNYTPTDSLRRHGTFMHIDTVNVRIWTYMQDTTNADSGWVKIFPIDVPPAILNGEVVGPIANNKLGVVNRIKFNTTYTPIVDTLGTMWFDTNSETINAIINGGTRYQLGEELFYPIIINKSGSAILKGQLVMVDTVTPISGDHIRVVPAVNNGTYSSTTIMGVAASQIENDATGLITWFGYVSELKQSEIAQTGITLDIGDILYPSTTQAGRYTDIAPSSPSHKSSIALVVRKPSDNNITILVRPWLAPKLDDLSNVDVTGRIINSGLLWNGANWKATTNQIPTIATGNEDYLVKFKGTDLNTGEITIGNSVVKESTDSIGIDITPTEKLDVGGTLRVRNTNKPVTTTKLLGVNANGVVQEVSVPTGLSGNSLVITGSTDLSTQQSSANVNLNSSTGNDVTLIPGGGTTLTSGGSGTNVTISSSNIYNSNGSVPENTDRTVTVPETSSLQLTSATIAGKTTQHKPGVSVYNTTNNTLQITSGELYQVTNSSSDAQISLRGGRVDVFGNSGVDASPQVAGLSVTETNKVVVTQSSSDAATNMIGKAANNELKTLTPLETRTFILPTQNGNNGKYLRTSGSDVTWADIVAGVSSVTATSPLSSSGGANPNITIQQANTSQSGFLSSTDWTTFNNKQSQLNGIGFVKASGTTITYDNSTYLTSETGVTSFSAGTTGFTPSSATNGAITLAGTLAIGNGGTGATTAATARTSLGGTTIGQSMFTLTNPDAITFPRFNANNTISALSASDFRTAIGAGTVTGTGTNTHVTFWNGTSSLSSSANMTWNNTTGRLTLANDVLINGVTVGLGNSSFSTNLAVGASALSAATTGATNNVAVGSNALKDNTNTPNNIAIGEAALQRYRRISGTGGIGYNTAIGGSALTNLVVNGSDGGANNTGIGNSTMINMTTGDGNTAVGTNTLYNVTVGNRNIAIGQAAIFGQAGVSGVSENIAIGVGAMQNVGSNSTNNVAIGRASLLLTGYTGTYGTYIGAFTNASSTTATYETVIGAGATGSGSNTTTIGRVQTTKTVLPGGTLTLGGTPPDIASANNQVLLRNTSTGDVSSLVGTVTDQVLKWDGSKWYAGADEGGGSSSGLTSLNGQTASVQTFTQGAGISISSAVSPTHSFSLIGQALAFHNLATNGIVARTATGTVAARTITGTSPITVTNGDGVSANPTIALNTVPIASGGTGQTTQQAALNALAGATTSGQYLRGNGTNVTMSTIQAADIPAQITSNTTGSAATLTTARTIQTNLGLDVAASFNGSANITPGVTGTLPIANGGTNLNTLPQAGHVLIGNNASGYFLSRPTELPAAITSGTSVTFNFNYKSSGVFRLAHTTTTNINSFSYSNMVVGGIYAFHISGASNSAQITVQWPTGTNGFKDLTASTNYGTRVYTTPTIITCYYDGTQFVCE